MESRSAEQNALLLEQMQQLWFNPQLQHYNQQYSTNPVSFFSATTGQHCVTPHDESAPPPPPSTHRRSTPSPPPPPEPTTSPTFPQGPPPPPCNTWEQHATSQHPLPFHDHPHGRAWPYIYQPSLMALVSLTPPCPQRIPHSCLSHKRQPSQMHPHLAPLATTLHPAPQHFPRHHEHVTHRNL